MQANFIFMGDTHLERVSNIFPDKDWIAWSLRPFYQVENYAVNNGIEHVIQTGDLFDCAEPSQEIICALIDFLDQSKLKWYFSLGNHDIESRKKHSLILLKYFSQKKKLKNCFFFPRSKAIKIAGIRVIFLPYPLTKHKLLNNKPSLIVAHVERKGAKYDNGRKVTDYDFDLGRHYWVIGHLHQYQKGDQHVFVGAPMQLRYGDSEKKYFLDASVKQTNNSIRVKYKKKLLTLPYTLRDATIDKLEDLDKVFANINKQVFLRLFVNSEIAIPSEYLSHPQVLKHKFYGDKKDIQSIKEEFFDLKTIKVDSQSRITTLKSWLESKSKLPKRKIKRAIKLAKTEEKLLQQENKNAQRGGYSKNSK